MYLATARIVSVALGKHGLQGKPEKVPVKPRRFKEERFFETNVGKMSRFTIDLMARIDCWKVKYILEADLEETGNIKASGAAYSWKVA